MAIPNADCSLCKCWLALLVMNASRCRSTSKKSSTQLEFVWRSCPLSHHCDSDLDIDTTESSNSRCSRVKLVSVVLLMLDGFESAPQVSPGQPLFESVHPRTLKLELSCFQCFWDHGPGAGLVSPLRPWFYYLFHSSATGQRLQYSSVSFQHMPMFCYYY